jgi:NTP pyrophosphatase (non-canonical NTP hydrolase)
MAKEIRVLDEIRNLRFNDFETYRMFAEDTAIYPEQKELLGLLYAVLGLAGEAGELANKTKKILRDSNKEITPEFMGYAMGELGDILWYLSAVCTELDIDLGQVAKVNLTTLYSRKERGVLKGDGDNR